MAARVCCWATCAARQLLVRLHEAGFIGLPAACRSPFAAGGCWAWPCRSRQEASRAARAALRPRAEPIRGPATSLSPASYDRSGASFGPPIYARRTGESRTGATAADFERGLDHNNSASENHDDNTADNDNPRQHHGSAADKYYSYEHHPGADISHQQPSTSASTQPRVTPRSALAVGCTSIAATWNWSTTMATRQWGYASRACRSRKGQQSLMLTNTVPGRREELWG